MYTWVIWAVTGFSLWEGRGRGALRPPCRMASTRLPGPSVVWEGPAHLGQFDSVGTMWMPGWAWLAVQRIPTWHSANVMQEQHISKGHQAHEVQLSKSFTATWFPEQRLTRASMCIPANLQPGGTKWVARLAISSFKGRLNEKVIVYTLLAGGINPTTYIMKIE